MSFQLTSQTPQRLRFAAPRLRVGILLAVCAVMVGCAPKEDVVLDPVVLDIDGVTVRASELQQEIDSLQANGAHVAYDRERFIEGYVERQIALQQARELGLENDPELRRQWENLLIGRLKTETLNAALASVTISDEEVAAYYEANLDQYTVGAKMRAALLRLEYGEHASDTAVQALRAKFQEAQQLAQALPVDTKGFGALAMRYSDEGTSRFKGGDIGWSQAGHPMGYRWPEAVVQALFALSPDAPLSDVIETENALYLLKYTDHRPEVVRPLDASLSHSIQQTLLANARADAKASLRSKWAAGRSVEIDREALKQLKFIQPELAVVRTETPQGAPLQ